MSLRAIGVVVLLASLASAGCGTVTNVVVAPRDEGGKTPFGGVRQDMEVMHKAANGEFALGVDGRAKSDRAQMVPLLFGAADLPLSFLADVVMWPYTASYTLINQPIPSPPVTQAPFGARPETPPIDVLPQPKILPPVTPTR